MIRQPKLYLLTMMALIMANGALGQSAELEHVRVATTGTAVSVEVELTQAIAPMLTYARDPNRMIIDFPGVRPTRGLQPISVRKSGVKRVRVGLYRATPPITRVVIDVDALRPFTVEASGEKFLLNILTSAQPLDEEAESVAEHKTEIPLKIFRSSPVADPPRRDSRLGPSVRRKQRWFFRTGYSKSKGSRRIRFTSTGARMQGCSKA